jgi:hypothetical protein
MTVPMATMLATPVTMWCDHNRDIVNGERSKFAEFNLVCHQSRWLCACSPAARRCPRDPSWELPVHQIEPKGKELSHSIYDLSVCG